MLFFVLIGVLLFGPMRLVLEQNCKRKADAPSGDVTLVWDWWPPSFRCDYLLPDGRHVVLPWG